MLYWPRSLQKNMAKCAICIKDVAVCLYIRAKPMVQVGVNKYKDPGKEGHRFYGYWPKESHLAEYLRLEKERELRGTPDPILQRLWESNCQGHPLEEIISVIEESMAPIPGIAVKILWNPSPRVTDFLFAETNKQRREAELHVNQDLRWTIVYSKAEVRQRIEFLVNNSWDKIVKSISYPGSSIKAG